MLHRDSTGFPLSVKPSHLFDSAEQMNTAEILAAIVEKACLFVPDVGVSNAKKPKRPIKESQYPKEALSEVDKVSKEALTSVEKKVFVASSDLVRFKCVLN